jgi:hypothetical protein
MKRIQINATRFLLPMVVAITLFSCVRKDNFFASSSPSTRKAVVKILGGGTPAVVVKNPIDFVSTPQRVLVVDLRRDPTDEGELNTSMTVVVKDDTTAVRNADPSYLDLPGAWYTIDSESPKVGGKGGTFTFLFKPGEFAKQIYITIPNATLLDPSSLYALGFTITSVTGSGVISTSKSVVIEIGAKNDWDGIYAVTGPMTDYANPALVQWNNPAPSWGDPFPIANGGAWELHLITFGATRCYMYDNTIWGDYFHPILNGTSNSGYGSFALAVDFDPATNAVSNVFNIYGLASYGGSGAPNYVASNGRSAVLDPSGINAVQGNKDILIKYFMMQPSVVPVGPRTAFDEKWKYIGPR